MIVFSSPYENPFLRRKEVVYGTMILTTRKEGTHMNSTQLQLLVDSNHKRWFIILSHLERSTVLSKTQLAKILNTSTRTITSDMKDITTYFNQTATFTITNNGYALTVNNKVAYLEKKKELLEYEPILSILSGIFYGEKLSIFEWADRLYLSDRTLISYLKKIEGILDRYQLKINYQSLLTLQGNEIDIRNFFLALFYEEDTLPHHVLPPIIISNLINNLSMSEFNYLNLNVPHFKLAYLLFITYQRIDLGYTLEIKNDIINTLFNSNLARAMKVLKVTFETYTQINLPKTDLTYLMLMLLDSGSYDEKLVVSSDNSDELDTLFLPLISDFCDDLGLLNDQSTTTYLLSFFHLYYLKNEASPTCLLFPLSLTDYFETNYHNELKIMIQILSKYPNGFWRNSSTNFEYNLLFVSIRLMYKSITKRLNIAFLFEGSTEVTTLLEELTRMYVPSIHTVHFLHTQTLLESVLEELSIDLVVTNFSEYIFELSNNMAYLLFNYIPTAEDWNNLVRHIDPRVSKKYKTVFSLASDA